MMMLKPVLMMFQMKFQAPEMTPQMASHAALVAPQTLFHRSLKKPEIGSQYLMSSQTMAMIAPMVATTANTIKPTVPMESLRAAAFAANIPKTPTTVSTAPTINVSAVVINSRYPIHFLVVGLRLLNHLNIDMKTSMTFNSTGMRALPTSIRKAAKLFLRSCTWL